MDPVATVNSAVALFKSLWYNVEEKEVFKRCENVAKQGQADAQCQLGSFYYFGRGVGRDVARGVKWYKKAADQGHALAQYNLGLCYEQGRGVIMDKTRAMEWYKKAADQGHAIAQYNLGLCYEHGEGVGKDEARAVEWYRRAADQRLAAAQNNLGLCYERGKGVAKDEGCAVEWYGKAADQGYEAAQYNLGLTYEHGRGVGKDRGRAVEWYRKAANQGLAVAQNNLGLCYKHGEGVVKDEAQAVEWFRKAANQGHSDAQGNLAELFAEGLGGLARDWIAAAKLFELATKDPDLVSAKLCLAWLLWTGRGVGQDVVRAQLLCAQVRSRDNYAQRLAAYVASGPIWSTVLDWFQNTMATPEVGSQVQVASALQPDNAMTTRDIWPPQVASEPHPDNTTIAPESGTPKVAAEFHPELLSNLRDRLAQLETRGSGSFDDLELNETQRKYLARMLGREGNQEAIENERRDIVKDPCMRRYYHALQQSLCWMFVGAQACKSGLVKKQHDLLMRGLIQASSKIAGLLPVYGHLVEGVVKSTAGEVADYFAGSNAVRIARAGGTDGGLVSEGVARYLVFARKGELSSVPKDATGKTVAKMVKRDVERMMTWVKSESDLSAIREESDVIGEEVVQRLVVAAEPSWAQPIRLAATPGPAHAAQSLDGSVGAPGAAVGAPVSTQTVDVETFRKLVTEMDGLKEQMRKMKAAMPNEGSIAFETDAGGGQAFVQIQKQESATGGASRADTSMLQQDFAQLCVVVDELKGRIDFYERRGFRAL